MKPWRLTSHARNSLVDIALWTLDRFGPAQAEIYERELLERCEAVAEGRAVRSGPRKTVRLQRNPPNHRITPCRVSPIGCDKLLTESAWFRKRKHEYRKTDNRSRCAGRELAGAGCNERPGRANRRRGQG
ncbi:MAG: type II toxin-antitoxin system RelE/ParE family toxin [Maritimibacter sp.]